MSDKDKRVTFEEVMEKIRKDSDSLREKGFRFEILMRDALPLIPLAKLDIEEVFLWKDWEYSFGQKKDWGIDLVAKVRGGGWRAIQCKAYDAQVMHTNLSTFLNVSTYEYKNEKGDTAKFDSVMLVMASYEISGAAETDIKKGREQGRNIIVVDRHQLSNASIDWGDLAGKKPKSAYVPLSPRPHQKEAIKAIASAFDRGEKRGRLIMACGTGKTLVALKTAEKFVGEGKNVLVCVPSIALLSQTLNDFAEHGDSHPRPNYFVVCSDSEAGNEKDGDLKIKDLALSPTTNSEKLGEHMQDGNFNIVFSTYHSIDVVGEAQKEYGAPDFDLAICDEAHRTVGYEKDDGGGGEFFQNS